MTPGEIRVVPGKGKLMRLCCPLCGAILAENWQFGLAELIVRAELHVYAEHPRPVDGLISAGEML